MSAWDEYMEDDVIHMRNTALYWVWDIEDELSFDAAISFRNSLPRRWL